jgi:hypothetical protein
LDINARLPSARLRVRPRQSELLQYGLFYDGLAKDDGVHSRSLFRSSNQLDEGRSFVGRMTDHDGTMFALD